MYSSDGTAVVTMGRNGPGSPSFLLFLSFVPVPGTGDTVMH